MSATDLIPMFYLYGEPHRSVSDDFFHVELLDDRNRPEGWIIRPHTHAELNHIFHVSTGGGVFLVEDESYEFEAPCLLVVPAGAAHGFRWQVNAQGWVVTVSTSHLKVLCEQDDALGGIFRAAAVVPLDRGAMQRAEIRISDLLREFSWSSPGHRAAMNAALLEILVIALRQIDPFDRDARPLLGRKAELVARFRERIDSSFRLRESVADSAEALGVSLTQLRSTCASVAGQSPRQMLNQRTIIEAKRALLYTNLSIADIGANLGFADPAYFSRFFSQHVTISPRDFRQRRGDTTADTASPGAVPSL